MLFAYRVPLLRKRKRLRKGLRLPEPIWGWAFATRSFPAAHAWALSLSRAVCFPTPLSAACGCLGLMAGPSRPLPVGIFRVRPLRPVRTPPAGSGAPDVVQTRLQLSSRVGTVIAGTAPACGRPLAPRYGSDLLTLRLRSVVCSRAASFCGTAPVRRFHGLCQICFLRAAATPLRAHCRRATGALWRGWPAGTHGCVLVCAVATTTLWGNCVRARVETPRGRDSVCARFLIAARRTVPVRV